MNSRYVKVVISKYLSVSYYMFGGGLRLFGSFCVKSALDSEKSAGRAVCTVRRESILGSAPAQADQNLPLP